MLPFSWLKKRSNAGECSGWELEHSLLDFGSDIWSVRDACAGTLIFGDTGSGKTSGSGRSIALSMLRAGFGGLVMTVKSGETDRWREYLASCGREDDLVIFSPDSGHGFNFLEHEQSRSTRGGGATENIVELFVESMNAGTGLGAATSRDPFWDRALRQILRNTIDALNFAGEIVSIKTVQAFILSAPMSKEDIQNLDWQKQSYAFQVLKEAETKLSDDPVAKQSLDTTFRYWFEEYAEVMDYQTRGNIVSTFTTTADGFLRGDLFRLFSMETTITPEATFDGKVIVLDLPQKQFHKLGSTAQIIWKLCWQRAVEEAVRGAESRPVFLWVDEAQHFVSQSDADFIMTAREQKACCVYLTQAKSNYLQAFGAGNQAAADGFLGIPKTKIFHCNGDPETNSWACDVLSDEWTVQTQHSVGEGQKDKKIKNPDPSHSTSTSMQRQQKVFANEFGELASGGPANNYLVEAIFYQSGRRFKSTGTNFTYVSFDQREQPKSRRR